MSTPKTGNPAGDARIADRNEQDRRAVEQRLTDNLAVQGVDDAERDASSGPAALEANNGDAFPRDASADDHVARPESQPDRGDRED